MATQYDRALDIALGNNRKTKKWKNRTVQWSELVERLSRETRTPETVAEFRAMTLSRQSDVKDVGGFVGGYCQNGSRSNVAHRSVLCLDADFADDALWPDWRQAFGHAAALYSTHKHMPHKPRLRLVIPLARDVSPDEYQAIGRRVAERLGIDKFDDTTYQAQRVMYWPSTSSDGEYVFDTLDAPLLDPDKVLSTYHDWRDVSSWPMSSRVADIARKSANKQADPLNKSGVVGAFCRAYTISEAIEQFVPAYEPCDEPGRYTYTEGSTAAGVVVYDDKFVYSHHATDPASGQLCNAWDLVRLHKYSELDADTDPDTPASKRPSYIAMQRLATNDGMVKRQLLAERLADFDELPDEPAGDVDPDAWKSRLQFTDKGVMAQTITNGMLVLQNDQRLKNGIAFNEMDNQIIVTRRLPWDKCHTGPRQWGDSDDAQLRLFMESHYNLTSKDKLFDAVNNAAHEAAFHPVKEYLESCVWDGVPRVETLLVDYLGAADTPYTRAVTRKTLAAAVARIYRPGCKFDFMLTLRGGQGIGKSTLVKRLGVNWYSDTFTTMQGKDAYEQVQGVWVMEVGELAGMRKAEAETIKLYISKQSDRFRPAYGRRLQEFPRQCIFIGTTNETQFLRDTTGNRRFWVVDTPNKATRDLWSELDDDMVRLIWAEAVEIFKAGETLYLDRELEAVARDVQAAYEEENPKAGVILDYLERLLPSDWDDRDVYSRRQWLESGARGCNRRRTVCTLEIWAEALGGIPDRLDRYAAKEIRDVLAGLPEWRHCGNKRITAKPYGRQRYYERK